MNKQQLHLLVIGMIEFISSTDHETAKILRVPLIDTIDTNRNENGDSLDIIVDGFTIEGRVIEVQVIFDHIGIYDRFTVDVNTTDVIKHMHLNGDSILIDQKRNLINETETLLQIQNSHVSQYIQDILNGRIAFKSLTSQIV